MNPFPIIKILIADDHRFITEGLKMLINTYDEFEVVQTVTNGKEAINYCRNHPVDIALLDIRMPKVNGIEAAKEIDQQSQTKPVILTTFDEDQYIIDAIKNGARGYLLKHADPEQIREILIGVYKGHNMFQETVWEKVKSHLGEGKPRIDTNRFTAREMEVMTLIARGLSNKEIAKRLYLSEGTVANYITSILNKTGLEHRTQIAIYYLTGELSEDGIMDPNQ